MLFVTAEMVRPVLFSLALFARALIAAAVAHWVTIGVAVLMGANPNDVVWTTATIVILLAVTTIGSVAAVRKSQPGGRMRMTGGARTVTQWRRFVLTIGGASQFGGLLLYVTGYLQAGLWAMGIGTAMVVFEVAAIVGVAIDAVSDRQHSP